MKRIVWAVFLFGAVLFGHPSYAQDSKPYYKGKVVASFLPDGRNMRLEQPFGFVDAKGVHWDVPSGAETDGASIPQIFWISHPPFTGKYRDAAVIHDFYCRAKTRGWKDTHAVFYDAMLAAGLDELNAKVMYASVYNFGPRWGAGVKRAPGAHQVDDLVAQKKFMRDFEDWVARANPSRADIARAIDTGNIP